MEINSISVNNDTIGNESSQFNFEVESQRPEVTEQDETEIKMDPHETLTEGIKYRSQSI